MSLKKWEKVSNTDLLDYGSNDGEIFTDPLEPYIPLTVSEVQENILMKIASGRWKLIKRKKGIKK